MTNQTPAELLARIEELQSLYEHQKTCKEWCLHQLDEKDARIAELEKRSKLAIEQRDSLIKALWTNDNDVKDAIRVRNEALASLKTAQEENNG